MNLDDLEDMAEEVRAADEGVEHEVRVCMAASCQSSGAPPVLEALRAALPENNRCKVKGVGCMGLCSGGPLVAVQPKGGDTPILYRDVRAEDAGAIVASVGGAPVERLRCPTDIPFFARQQKIVLENSGIIDPDSFKGYVAVGGYAALVRALTEMTPADVLREVTASGLRGRGGAGYPDRAQVGPRWPRRRRTRSTSSATRDEGDPGRLHGPQRARRRPPPGAGRHGHRRLRRRRHARATSTCAPSTRWRSSGSQTAIRQAKRAGLLGSNVCETQFAFDIEIRLGAGAFVCGEETALMASIEGLRGQPRPRPPYPAEAGLWG